MADWLKRINSFFFHWFPVAFLVTITLISYYAFNYQLCWRTLKNTFQSVAFILMYHGFLFMFSWSYTQTLFSRQWTVPSYFKLSADQIQRLSPASGSERDALIQQFSSDLPISSDQPPRYCEICRCIKPDRCHHCSRCGICVLKMDHHCAWANNCIGFTNYKFFVLFLLYDAVYCFFMAVASAPYFISAWDVQQPDLQNLFLVFLFFGSLMFGISLFLLFLHHMFRLVAKDLTTLEFLGRRGKDLVPNVRKLTGFANFKEIFGDDVRLWFVPVFTSQGDGVRFKYDGQGNYQSNAQSESLEMTTKDKTSLLNVEVPVGNILLMDEDITEMETEFISVAVSESLEDERLRTKEDFTEVDLGSSDWPDVRGFSI